MPECEVQWQVQQDSPKLFLLGYQRAGCLCAPLSASNSEQSMCAFRLQPGAHVGALTPASTVPVIGELEAPAQPMRAFHLVILQESVCCKIRRCGAGASTCGSCSVLLVAAREDVDMSGTQVLR